MSVDRSSLAIRANILHYQWYLPWDKAWKLAWVPTRRGRASLLRRVRGGTTIKVFPVRDFTQKRPVMPSPQRQI
jgi:hypothetical protein